LPTVTHVTERPLIIYGILELIPKRDGGDVPIKDIWCVPGGVLRTTSELRDMAKAKNLDFKILR